MQRGGKCDGVPLIERHPLCSGRFTADELTGVKRVLSAAALTYVAAMFVSLMSLLRLILIVSGNSRRRND